MPSRLGTPTAATTRPRGSSRRKNGTLRTASAWSQPGSQRKGTPSSIVRMAFAPAGSSRANAAGSSTRISTSTAACDWRKSRRRSRASTVDAHGKSITSVMVRLFGGVRASGCAATAGAPGRRWAAHTMPNDPSWRGSVAAPDGAARTNAPAIQTAHDAAGRRGGIWRCCAASTAMALALVHLERPLRTGQLAGCARDLPGARPHQDPLPVSENDHPADDLRRNPHLLHHGPDVVAAPGLLGRGDHRETTVLLELLERVADALAVRLGLRAGEAALAGRAC